MKIYCTIIIFLLTGSFLDASDESLKRLKENRVCLFSDIYGVSVMVERGHDGIYSMVAKMKNVSISIPKKELSMFSDLNLRSVSLNSYFDGGGNIPKDKPVQSLVVGVKYGGSCQHGSEKDPVIVYSYLKLYFENDKFKGWRSAEPEGKFRNKWIIRDKDADGKIVKSEPIEMIDCPTVPQGSD